jgi:2-polyprenyl-3-methyl-5-hydroxy-6-metoxy-1,4-benzoquinol methylase
MYIVERTKNLVSAFLKSYGPSGIKRVLWDKEFSSTKWDFINDTTGDCVYSHVEAHLNKGSVLDLGCGPGNTANELAFDSYQTYVGVDISEAALDKGRKRTQETGRTGKNNFVSHDFLNYEPSQKFDVILFRESMYHVPMGKITDTLRHYQKYLKDGGVFVVRMGTSNSDRPKAMIQIMEANFDVVEKRDYNLAGGTVTVVVFKPRRI